MNEAHLHLILVHIPIVLVPFGALALTASMYFKKTEITFMALNAFVLASLFSVAAFSVGEGAEELVEDLSGIVKSVIETHEEAAEVSLWLTSLLGVISLVCMYAMMTKRAISGVLLKIVLLLSVLGSASLFYTGNQGGKIRHPEAFDTLLVSSNHDDDD